MITDLERAEATTAAGLLWNSFDDNQRAAVRIGMIPIEAQQQCPEIPPRDLAVALMDQAKADGGMIA